MKKESQAVIFEKKQVRRVWHENQWWFVVEDVVLALIESRDPKQYIQKMKQRDPQLLEGWVQIVHTLDVLTGGGTQKMICSNTEGVFRIIQSIPSSKAEPFKRWLARVGKERIDEINNPELAMDRMRKIYDKKGYPKDWIDKRVRGIAVRQDLTREWQDRGVLKSIEFAILTNEIMQGTFDMKVDEYKSFKRLSKENLRDHMDDIELILTMLAEATTTRITRDRNSRGFPRLKKDAKDGGAVGGRTRRDIELTSGRKVISRENYLPKSSMGKIKKLK
ncbi:MAG: Bro-N domain-containing protein [Candidatus Levybacteria bacterium]|nr:Bro-N domain-containing protein [Candidatus Levybacteria bacterium]